MIRHEVDRELALELEAGHCEAEWNDGVAAACPTSRTAIATQAHALMAIDPILVLLEKRLGRLHARQRLGIERDHEAQVFGQGLNFFHIENMTSSHVLIRAILMISGMYGRGLRNAAQVCLRYNFIKSHDLPESFDGFTILHLSDLHVDMSGKAMERVIGLVRDLSYDICILTGDYRGLTYGPYEAALEGMAAIRGALRGPVYGVLGNHDTIRMVPGLEAMGVRILLNERETLTRGGGRVHLAGIDDAHFFRVDNIEKAAADIPDDEFSILISHTPEIYRQAAHAGFNLLLSGHTHGGQICLPGGTPIILEAVLPRYMGSGAWTYHDMMGYTSVGAGSSVVPVRFNCPPEITLHRLQRP
jgi:predicted MPP superfamily phosphohydrolase